MSSLSFRPRNVLLKTSDAEIIFGTPLKQIRSRYLLVKASQGAMHLSDGRFVISVARSSVASQELPHMLTAP